METSWHTIQSNILGTILNLLGRVRHNISFQVQHKSSLGMFGYVDLHIRIFVCLFTKARYTAFVPSGKMHLSILTSIFYIIPIPTSLFLLTLTSLHLSTDTPNWRNWFLPGSFWTVTCSPKQELKLRRLSIIKPPELPYKAWHAEQV